MTTDTVPAEAASDDHHEWHQSTAFQPRANRLGLWLFIFSEVFLFSAFLAARFYTTGTERPDDLNQNLALAVTIVLLISSVSAYLAETAIKFNKRKYFVIGLSVTLLMGLLFMVGVSIELHEATLHYPPETAYGSSYFMLIGLHAFHVITGMIALLIVFVLGIRGYFGSTNYWGVEGAVKYWHFVDLAWVFIYPTLYLL